MIVAANLDPAANEHPEGADLARRPNPICRLARASISPWDTSSPALKQARRCTRYLRAGLCLDWRLRPVRFTASASRAAVYRQAGRCGLNGAHFLLLSKSCAHARNRDAAKCVCSAGRRFPYAATDGLVQAVFQFGHARVLGRAVAFYRRRICPSDIQR